MSEPTPEPIPVTALDALPDGVLVIKNGDARELLIPLGLPPGSVITFTITIGPPPIPEPALPEPVKSRYLGSK